MKNISLFKNFTTEVGQRTLVDIVDGIRGDHYRPSILKIRALVQSGHKGKANQLKKELVAFTVSGLFEGGRKMPFLKTYNPFVILDIDKLDPAELPGLILKIKQIEFTRVCFISPSGRGLKIIVEVDSEMKSHKAAYWQVMNFYKDYLMVEIDKSGSDITRLCFMSYDPDVYFNPESSVYKILKSEVEAKKKPTTSPDLIPHRAPAILEDTPELTGGYTNAFATCVGRTDAEMVFEKGNRNNYIYRLGAFCCRAGIPLEVAVEGSKREFDFDNYELERTMRNAYNWKPAPIKEDEVVYVKTGKEFVVEMPPAFPDQVFDKLPAMLRKGCGVYKSQRKRDAYLTGALGVLSGCMPGVSGIYYGDRSYPNLFVFVIDPSENHGNDAVKSSGTLGDSYNDRIREVEKGNDKSVFLPTDPGFEIFVNQLMQNDGSGILFDPPIKPRNGVLNPGWNAYLKLMSNAFHHDTISSIQDFDKEADDLKLSVVIYQPLHRFADLISSVKDDLYSRFMFYVFEDDVARPDIPEEEMYKRSSEVEEALSKEVLMMANFLESHPTEFELTKRQWEILKSDFSKLSGEIHTGYGRYGLRVVKRMGIILFRIAMILSAIRKFEEKNLETKLVCNDHDFQVAKSLVATYLEHSLFLYDCLPEPQEDGFDVGEYSVG